MMSPDLPPGLNVFLEFISGDDRPTFVLDQSTNPKVVFRNSALDILLSRNSLTSLFPDWVQTLHNAASDCTAQLTQRNDGLGTFAARTWSSKKIANSWTVVFCSQDHDYNVSIETQPELWPVEIRETRPTEHTDNQGRQGLDNTSSSRTSTHELHSDSDVNMSSWNGDELLGDLVVDWLSFPDLTPDPWIKFLVNHDWDKTFIGSIQTWPSTLRQMYSTIIASAEPRVLYWGNDLCMFYNEAARFLVGEMHPHPLGNPLADVWGKPMLVELAGILKAGIKRGKPLRNRRRELSITRHGFPESAFFDFVFLPIPSPSGRFLGFVNEFVETTESIMQENRVNVFKTILESISSMSVVEDLWTGLLSALDEESMDVSYAMVFGYSSSLLQISDNEPLRLRAASGIECSSSATLLAITAAVKSALKGPRNDVVVLQQRKKTLPLELAVSVPDVGTVNTAYVMPIPGLDAHQLSAVVILGLSPARRYDSSSRQFAASLRDLLFKTVTLFALPSEQRKVREITTALSQQLQSATLKAEKSELNFRRMVHDAPIGMCIHGTNGFPIYVNDSYLNLFGMSRAEYFKAAESGHAWEEAVIEDDRKSTSRAWSDVLETKKPGYVEFRVHSSSSPTGSRWLNSTIHQCYDADDKLLFLYGWLTDISSRKLTEFLIEEKLASALETKRSSESFIDMVSHEMRNPLSSILQLADNILMSLPPVSEDDQPSILTTHERAVLVDTAQTILLCAKHQKVIIDEVLTFSKLDSKLLLLAPERIKPPEIAKSALKMLTAELDHADIHGTVEIERSYTDLKVDCVLLDPGRLSQIIINLLTNAVKFTKDSSTRQITISLAAWQTKPTADDCRVTLIEPRGKLPMSTYLSPAGEEVFLSFRVQDTGCGLTEEDMKHLFQKFSQASPKTYTKYGGSGLGLFISRELVELQGGQIGVHSEAGKGSTFAFYLKAARVKTLTAASQPSLGLEHVPILGVDETPTKRNTVRIQDLHVLIVEDNAINQKVMAQQLRRMGCAKVYVADHGLDALKLLSTTTFFSPAGPDQIPLSVVLLDVEMPVMDGLTCARRIRELEMTREIVQHVPIIGITANARADQITTCIAAGMDEVMTKPFRMPQLIPRLLAIVDKYIPASHD